MTSSSRRWRTPTWVWCHRRPINVRPLFPSKRSTFPSLRPTSIQRLDSSGKDARFRNSCSIDNLRLFANMREIVHIQAGELPPCFRSLICLYNNVCTCLNRSLLATVKLAIVVMVHVGSFCVLNKPCSFVLQVSAATRSGPSSGRSSGKFNLFPKH